MFARADRHRAEARRAAQILNRYPAQVANEELKILITTVEDLIRGLALTADPEIARLRVHAQAALVRAKGAMAEGGARLQEHAGEFAKRGAARVREHPWAWVGLTALCGLAIGLWARSRGDEG